LEMTANPALSATGVDEKLAVLVEEITARLETGQRVDLSDYSRTHPDQIEQLRKLLPALEALALVGQDDGLFNGSQRDNGGDAGRRQLGDFRLIRELGRGGMGTVYEAEQISMGRRVALKVLPFAALAQDKSLQRFRNEVRAAAALDHPHIVSVYSVGEERGVHYYAMQLVRGQTLADVIEGLQGAKPGASSSESPTIDSAAITQAPTKPIEQGRISTAVDSRRAAETYRVAAGLGIQAAEALQHAHDLGVHHRDIKPSNLLLDHEGDLYVTDFGLARIEADAGMTLTGDIVGTLRYMAPEQALAKRVVVDHRADIYSLGATLYEVLTLQPAFIEPDRSELLKQIAFEEPRALRKLDRRIPFELETIVLKAMAKNPDERYQSAKSLVEDLRAFLDDRPIKAKPPTLLNRTAKWSRRHRGLVAATAVVLLLLTSGSMMSTMLLLSERQRTMQAAADSKAVVDFLVKHLLAAPPNSDVTINPNITIREAVAAAEGRIDSALGDQPLVEATVRNAIGLIYNALGKDALGEPHFRRALDVYTQELGPADFESVRARHNLANTLIKSDRPLEGRKVAEDGYEIARAALGDNHALTLRAKSSFMTLISQDIAFRMNRGLPAGDSDLALAQRLGEECLEQSRRIHGLESTHTLDVMNLLAGTYSMSGQNERALQMAQEALEISQKAKGLDDKLTLILQQKVAEAFYYLKRYDDATTAYEAAYSSSVRIYGPKDRRTLETMGQLAGTNFSNGKLSEARRLWEEVAEASREQYGSEHKLSLRAITQLVFVLRKQGDFERARQLQQELVETFGRALGRNHPDTLWAIFDLIGFLRADGKIDEGHALVDEFLKLLPHDHWKWRNNMAWSLAVHEPEQWRDGKRAVEVATKACELTDFKAHFALGTLAAAYAETGDFESAIKWCEKAIALVDKADEREELIKLLKSFRNGKPWREL
jgi:serine/threonine protein kinase